MVCVRSSKYFQFENLAHQAAKKEGCVWARETQELEKETPPTTSARDGMNFIAVIPKESFGHC